MKIPNSIRIAGVEYEVEIVPNLMDGANAVYGHIDYSNSIISLSDTFGTEHQKRCQILWHEILHGIRENNGMEIKNEEAVVDMFAKGIYQVLQDNARRLFDIYTVEMPPCKVGDTVYIIDRGDEESTDFALGVKLLKIIMSESGFEYVVDLPIGFKLEQALQLGTTLFLTKEDANKAIEEERKNG